MKSVLLPLGFTFCAVNVFALNASDSADNYGSGWTSGTNGGSGFDPWGFTTDADDTVEIADSSVAAGNINTTDGSFRVASNNGSSVNVIRSFEGGNALQAGDVFTFDLTANFRNGNKGVDLRNDGDTVFNFRVAGDNYIFGEEDLGAEGWSYVGDGVYTLEFEFVTETFMKAKIMRTSSFDEPRSFEIPNVSLSAPVNNFQFYVSGTDSDSEQNSLYFNNLGVSEVPEPAAVTLLAGVAALLFVARRRC